MNNKVTCECCGQETDISYERTQFLRWLLDNNHMFKGHYIQVVNKLELPDPDRLQNKKRSEMLGKIFVINEELRDIEDEELIEKLEMKKDKLHEQLRNNFGNNHGTENTEFDVDSLNSN
jgi:hypothetical protein